MEQVFKGRPEVHGTDFFDPFIINGSDPVYGDWQKIAFPWSMGSNF